MRATSCAWVLGILHLVSLPISWQEVGAHPLPSPGPSGTNHLLCLAEVDVLLVPAACLGILNVHEADEGHGAAAQQQDGEEHDDDRGGANELPLLHGLQVQVQAQGIRDSPPQAWGAVGSVRGGEREEVVVSLTWFSGDLGTSQHRGQWNSLRPPWRVKTHLGGSGVQEMQAAEKWGLGRSSHLFPLHRVVEQIR